MKKWRFCHKCSVLFFDGRAEKGTCPAGGGHEAKGLEFNLPANTAETAHAQGAWRFCQKCVGMFFDGFPEKGRCPAGGVHKPSLNVNFVLPHDVPERFPQTQSHWRFCHKCFGMFFDGFAQKGSCPAGDAHVAKGFVFVLPTTTVKIDEND